MPAAKRMKARPPARRRASASLLGAPGGGDCSAARRSIEPVHAGPEEPLLAAEQLVDDRLRDARPAGQLVHRGAGVAALGEQRLGELDQLALAHRARHPAVLEVLDAGCGSTYRR